MIKRILSSEEVLARIANFDKDNISTIYVLSYGSIMGSSYSDFDRILKYPLGSIFEALEDDHHIFIEIKEE